VSLKITLKDFESRQKRSGNRNKPECIQVTSESRVESGTSME